MPTNRTADGQQQVSIVDLQQSAHGEGHDYAAGSLHIRHHARVHHRRDTAGGRGRGARCSGILPRAGGRRRARVFTDHLVAMGAQVEVTEMSASSARLLQDRFRHNDRVQVVLDQDGGSAGRGGPVDVVVCLSVPHHIPDYLSAVRCYVEQIAPGGVFVSFQDPLWYARQSRLSRLVDRVAYLMWRLTQGEFRRGLATVSRRLRGELDETKISDMVAYHVVRAGVDEVALQELLRPHFEAVRLVTYWSTQADWTRHWAAASAHRLPLA